MLKLFLMLLCVASLANAESDIDQAVDAYNRKDYMKAYTIFKDRAVKGDAFAQTFIGWMYDNGEGVAENDVEAVRWFSMAAEQGHVRAQIFLGTRYANGNGAPKDLLESAKWFQRAADQGNPFAQVTIAAMYEKGEGVRSDLVQSYKWASLAANQGNAKARTLQAALHQTMTLAQMEEAERLISVWRPKLTSSIVNR